MAKSHGKDAVFKLEDSSTTLRDISDYANTAGLDRSADLGEVTNFGSSGKREYIPGLTGATVPIEGFYDPTVDGYLDGIFNVEKGFEYYPNTTGSGGVKYSGNGILESYNADSSVDSPNSISGTFRVTGAVSRTTL